MDEACETVEAVRVENATERHVREWVKEV